MVKDTTGDVIFNVRFDVIAFKPEKSEILDGVVSSVNIDGIVVYSGPIKSYIKGYVSILQNDNQLSFRECPNTTMILLLTSLPPRTLISNQSNVIRALDTKLILSNLTKTSLSLQAQ